MTSYGGKFDGFVSFCEAHRPPLCPVPASLATVMLYVGELARRGTIQAKNLQPYLSAINKVHVDLDLPPPALGRALGAVRHGMALAQQALHARDARFPLPAHVVLSALRLGYAAACRLAALTDPSLLAASPDAAVFRACTVLVVMFVTFCRPHTAAALLQGDCVFDAAAGLFRVSLRTEKPRAGEIERRFLNLDFFHLRGPVLLLHMWLAFRMRLGLGPQSPLFKLPLPREGAPSSSSINKWVKEAVSLAGFVPSPGLAISGYCTRKGGTTAAHSVNVPLTIIRHVGGWAPRSEVVLRYIDVSIPPSPAARLFFQYLCASSAAAQSPPPSLFDWLGYPAPPVAPNTFTPLAPSAPAVLPGAASAATPPPPS